jgi:hypothetical protein
VILPPPAARPACVRSQEGLARRSRRLQLPPDRPLSLLARGRFRRSHVPAAGRRAPHAQAAGDTPLDLALAARKCPPGVPGDPPGDVGAEWKAALRRYHLRAPHDQPKDEILETAQEPWTTRQLGINTDEIGEQLRAVIQTMTLEGVLLRAGAESLWSNAPSYVGDTWLETPGGLPEVSAPTWHSRGRRVPACFRPHVARESPVVGVPKERASAALGSVETFEVGDGYLLPSGDHEGFEAAEALERGSVDLLLKWDCYTMGYASDGRRRFVHPEAQACVYNEADESLGWSLVKEWKVRRPGRGGVLRRRGRSYAGGSRPVRAPRRPAEEDHRGGRGCSGRAVRLLGLDSGIGAVRFFLARRSC